MSRVYGYDLAGRLTSVNAAPPHPFGIPSPFTGNYGYDAFNNMTSRSGRFALNPDQSDSANYVNNRRVQSGWSYDADGRVLTSTDTSDSGGSSTQTWSYDAAGNEVTVSQLRNSQTTTNTLAYDGDGQLIYESVSNGTTDYRLRSTVLGAVLTGLDTTGNNMAGISTTPWSRRTDPSGLQDGNQAIDPFGNHIYNVQPPVSGPPPYVPFYGATWGGASWSSFINANNFTGGCYSAQNNNPALCSDAMLQQDQQMREFWGPQYYDLPGHNNEMERGYGRHLSIINSGYDPDLSGNLYGLLQAAHYDGDIDAFVRLTIKRMQGW